jgi:hypothetical protein
MSQRQEDNEDPEEEGRKRKRAANRDAVARLRERERLEMEENEREVLSLTRANIELKAILKEKEHHTKYMKTICKSMTQMNPARAQALAQDPGIVRFLAVDIPCPYCLATPCTCSGDPLPLPSNSSHPPPPPPPPPPTLHLLPPVTH